MEVGSQAFQQQGGNRRIVIEKSGAATTVRQLKRSHASAERVGLVAVQGHPNLEYARSPGSVDSGDHLRRRSATQRLDQIQSPPLSQGRHHLVKAIEPPLAGRPIGQRPLPHQHRDP